MKVSEHFDSSEFACHCCGELPHGGMSKKFILALERLRAVFDAPIIVTNGHRCVNHNREVGGVANSQHLRDCAADIYIEGVGVWELGREAKKLFDGVGFYYHGGFVHVDMRDDGMSIGHYIWDDEW